MPICNLCRRRVDADARLWTKDGFDVLRCPRCSLVFRADPPDVAELPGIYALDYFRDDVAGANRNGYADYLRDEPLHRRNARRRLNALATRSAGAGRLLDVGCAAGFFVAEAVDAGWAAEGVDVSREMVACSRRNLRVDVTEGTLQSIDGGPFDAITMWDYIEHAVDPAADIACAGALLRRGGILALSTGDVESLVARVSGRRWHLLTPRHHNFFFSRRTLRRLLGEAGFEIQDVSHEASLYSLQHVVYKLETLVPLAAVRRAAKRAGSGRFGALAFPLNLFDVVTVLARKQ